jgi:hypothetical protein
MSGTLTLDLPSGKLSVPAANWGSMSDADRQSFIQHVVSSVGPQVDSSFGSDVQSGAHTAMADLGNAAQGLGSAANDIGLPGVGGALSSGGNWLKQNAPDQPANYHPRGADIMSDVRAGNYGRAAGDVAHGLAQNAAPIGGALLAGAGGEAIGLPAAAGAAAVGGALGLGQGAGQAAAQAGRQAPNTADVEAGLPQAALGAATSGVGFGRLGKSVLGRVGLGAGMSAANTAGTAALNGQPLDSDQVANSAIIGGAGAAVPEAIGAGRAGIKAGVDNAQLAGMPAPSTDQAMAQIGLQNDVNDTGIGNRTRAYNNTKRNYQMELQSAVKNVADDATANGVDPNTVKSGVTRANTIIRDIAGRHNNEMTSQDALNLMDALSWARPEDQETILNGTQALNAGADQSIIKNQTGPMTKLFGNVARYGGGLVELAHGNPMAALGLMGLGHVGPLGNAAGRVGGAVGLGFDKLFGTATPANDLAVMKAAQQLKAVGIDPTKVGSPLQALQDLNRNYASPQQVTGARPGPVPTNTPLPPAAQPQATAPLNPQQAYLLHQAAALGNIPGTPPRSPSAALAQAQALGQLKSPVQVLGSPQAPPPASGATPVAPQPPLSPTASQGSVTEQPPPPPMCSPSMHPRSPLWERLVAHGDPNVTRQQVREAAAQAYSPEHLAWLDAQRSFGDPAAMANPIRQVLAGQSVGVPPKPNGVYQKWQWGDASVQDYHHHATNTINHLRAIGLPAAADAVMDIAINGHNQEDKRAIYNALPADIQQHIPQALLKHGPKKGAHDQSKP